MVEIDAHSYMVQERGICKKVKEQKRGMVFELLDKTERNSKEYAIALVEDGNGGLEGTRVIEGDEGSIATESVAELRLEVPSAVDSFNTNENGVHLLHTHPGGFPDLSFNDIMVQLKELDKGIKFKSSLVATLFGGEGGDTALVNGMELVEEPGEREKDRMLRFVDSIHGMFDMGEISANTAKDRVWEEIDGSYQSCSVRLER